MIMMTGRETREGWLLLTLETEVSGNSKSTKERGFPLLVHWACHAGTKDFCFVLATLVGPAENIFFLTVYYFYSFVPSPLQARQAAVLGRLSVSMCLW